MTNASIDIYIYIPMLSLPSSISKTIIRRKFYLSLCVYTCNLYQWMEHLCIMVGKQRGINKGDITPKKKKSFDTRGSETTHFKWTHRREERKSKPWSFPRLKQTN